MGRLFGTDGARGVAITELTCELAMQIGRAAAMVLTKETNHKAKIIIGKDTRISGDPRSPLQNKKIIAARRYLNSSFLTPHSSLFQSVYSLHFSRVSTVCGTHIQRLFYLYKRLSALFALNENKPWGTLWVFVNCPQTLRLDAAGSHCRHYIA